MVRIRGFCQKTCLFLFIFLFGWILTSGSPIHAQTAEPETGKKIGGIQGDPGRKRGLDYGFDKGYHAGKADLDGGLKPDLRRHEAYKDPNKFYRYEFGSRANFVSGFRYGFIRGYQEGFGQKVSASLPTESETTGGGLSAAPVHKPQAPKRPSAASDAL